jgi:hypothetical protein
MFKSHAVRLVWMRLKETMMQNNWIDRARKQRELDFEPKYGPIQPKQDRRCFRREMVEELLDVINYAQWSFQKGEITRSHFQRIDKMSKGVIKLIEEACKDKFEWDTNWLT